MATVHTDIISLCEQKAIEYLYPHYKFEGRKPRIKHVKKMAQDGVMSVSGLLERVILDNSKLKRSHEPGEDFSDGSDAKYATARLKYHSQYHRKDGAQVKVMRCWATVGNLKNKKGRLRIFVNYYNPEQDIYKPYMFSIPYSVWSKNLRSSGVITFAFSAVDNNLAGKTAKRFAKYQVFSIKELAA